MAKTSSNNKHNSRNEDLLSDEQICFLRALLSTDKTTLTINKRALILLAIYNASGKKFTHIWWTWSLVNESRFIATPDRIISVKYRATSRLA